jgi:ABC-type methionine transport system ATPase subunit
MQALSKGRGAAFRIVETLKRVPNVDWQAQEGVQLDKVHGDIVFSSVRFSYPSRPDAVVLSGLDLSLNAGKTAALVGASGSGKSTVIQLLQRFYLPSSGSITLDGVELATLNVSWLRQQLGLVSQEPVLFATSIIENIRYGKEGTTDDEIVNAAKAANAYNFISALPKTFDTLVGERGTQLSGGQKQRIAIARAIVRDPKVLLLDEATSALDSESEKIVQDALDTIMKGRTTIVIAHRLSTVRDADTIYVFNTGNIVEQGTYTDLMSRDGHFAALVAQQQGGGAVHAQGMLTQVTHFNQNFHASSSSQNGANKDGVLVPHQNSPHSPYTHAHVEPVPTLSNTTNASDSSSGEHTHQRPPHALSAHAILGPRQEDGADKVGNHKLDVDVGMSPTSSIYYENGLVLDKNGVAHASDDKHAHSAKSDLEMREITMPSDNKMLSREDALNASKDDVMGWTKEQVCRKYMCRANMGTLYIPADCSVGCLYRNMYIHTNAHTHTCRHA